MGSTFAVTDAGSTIDSSSTTGFPLSFSGTVQPKADYSSFALLGFNVLEYSNGLVSSWAPPASSSGLTVNVSNPGGSEVRVQLEGQTTRWCFVLNTFNQDVTIPWGSFNTSCWDSSSSASVALNAVVSAAGDIGGSYSGQLLKSIAVTVPGDNVAPRPYVVSLNSVRTYEGALGTGGSGGGGPSTNTGGSENTGGGGGSEVIDSCPLGSWTRVDCNGLSAYVEYDSSGTGSITQPDCTTLPDDCPTHSSTIWFNWSRESETSVIWTYTSYNVCGKTSGIPLPPPESVPVSCSEDGSTLTQAGQTWTWNN